MKKRLINLLVKNWQWKILSLIAAVLFWYAYINLVDPVVTETFSDVRVHVLNYREFLDKKQELSFVDSSLDIENLTVNVTVRARTSVMEDLRNKKNNVLYVWIDPYELAVGDGRLLIHYEINSAYRYAFETLQFVEQSNQSYYEVKVEAEETVTVPLRYSIIGTPAEGYTYIEDDPGIMLTPNEISLTGPTSEVEDVDYAMIRVSVETAKANVALTEPISYFDAEGERVYFQDGAVTASVNAASLYVPIYQVKTLPLKLSFTGEVQEGYMFMNDAELSVKEIVVYGQESDLAQIDSIPLPEIDLSTGTGKQNQVFRVDEVLKALYPGGEVQYYSGDSSIRVSYTVEELLEKDVEITDLSAIAIGGLGERSLTFKDDSVTVRIRGTQKQLDEFTTDMLQMSANVSEAENGESTIKVVVIAPTSAVQVVSGEVQVHVEITEE